MDSIDASDEESARLKRIKKYWQIGRLVNLYKKKSGISVIEISKELKASPSLLSRYSQFNRVYNDGYSEHYADKPVKWYMFVKVMGVKDAKQRDFYLSQACAKEWDKYELSRRIKADYYHAFKDAKGYEPLNKLPAKGQTLYTYSARVKRVVDGDTLILDIDVGFKTTQEHRVRLRGIDCAELGTKKGEEAKQFVIDEIHKCVVKDEDFLNRETIPPLVVVKTYKQGMYGRYIVDVYYLPGENKAENIAKNGKLLNQVLFDKGFAKRIY